MYYKVSEIAENPGLEFEYLAANEEELNLLGLSPSSPYVVSQAVMESIAFDHGIFLKKLNGEGQLVDLTQAEIDAAETAHAPTKKTQLRAQLLELSNEIDLAERMSESTENLDTEFASVKAEYDAIVV